MFYFGIDAVLFSKNVCAYILGICQRNDASIIEDRMNHQHEPSTNPWFILFGPLRYLLHICVLCIYEICKYIYIYTCTWNCNDLVAVGKGLLLTGWPSKTRNHLSSRSIIWLGITKWIHALHDKWPSKNESVQIITHSIHTPYNYLNIYHNKSTSHVRTYARLMDGVG